MGNANVVVTECRNTGSVSDTGSNATYQGYHAAGGIMAYAQKNVTISNCHNEGAISSTRDAAGIVGGTTCGSTATVVDIRGCSTSEDNITTNNKAGDYYPILGKVNNGTVTVTPSV